MEVDTIEDVSDSYEVTAAVEDDTVVVVGDSDEALEVDTVFEVSKSVFGRDVVGGISGEVRAVVEVGTAVVSLSVAVDVATVLAAVVDKVKVVSLF